MIWAAGDGPPEQESTYSDDHCAYGRHAMSLSRIICKGALTYRLSRVQPFRMQPVEHLVKSTSVMRYAKVSQSNGAQAYASILLVEALWTSTLLLLLC